MLRGLSLVLLAVPLLVSAQTADFGKKKRKLDSPRQSRSTVAKAFKIPKPTRFGKKEPKLWAHPFQPLRPLKPFSPLRVPKLSRVNPAPLWPVKATRVPSASTPATWVGTVYTGGSGRKYHRDGCRYRKPSQTSMSSTKANAAGYKPCKVCGG
ncbi:hypothetical protein EON81_13260 [bacterium]|nr:MAG: hypothetical protein EON81_13260 [bacterium]